MKALQSISYQYPTARPAGGRLSLTAVPKSFDFFTKAVYFIVANVGFDYESLTGKQKKRK